MRFYRRRRLWYLNVRVVLLIPCHTLHVMDGSDSPPLLFFAVEVLGKPVSFVCVSFENADMAFAGTKDPCALVWLTSLGKLGPSVNPSITKAISELLKETCDIEANRMCKDTKGFTGDEVREG